MLTRLQEYRDKRKQRIAKGVAKAVEKVRKEAYKEGYGKPSHVHRKKKNNIV